jgi:hypothetical protein
MPSRSSLRLLQICSLEPRASLHQHKAGLRFYGMKRSDSRVNRHCLRLNSYRKDFETGCAKPYGKRTFEQTAQT